MCLYIQIHQMNIRQLIKEERAKVAPLDVDALLRNATEDLSLAGYTPELIGKEIYESLDEHFDDELIIGPLYSKLSGYRFVDEVYRVHRGKHVRWIRIFTRDGKDVGAGYLTNGGIVVDVKIQNNGVYILCKSGNRFVQYRFDDCLTYQKLSMDEQMILATNDVSQKR